MKLEEILPTAEIIPAVDQVRFARLVTLPAILIDHNIQKLELHVYNPQHKLIEYLHSKGIVPQAYSPLGSTNSPLFTDETITAVAAKHSLQPSDILLGYLGKLLASHQFLILYIYIAPEVAKGFVVLPKSVTPARIASNLTGALTASKKLDKADIEQLDGLAAAGKQKRFVIFFRVRLSKLLTTQFVLQIRHPSLAYVYFVHLQITDILISRNIQPSNLDSKTGLVN